MKTVRISWIAALAVVAMPTALYAQKGGKSASEPQAAAVSFMQMLDSGKFDDAYTAAAKSFQKQITKEQWRTAASSARDKVGGFKSRTLFKGQRMTKLPNMPDGNYAALQYKSVFSKAPSCFEVVVLELEADKKWHVNGYFVKPGQ